MTGLNNTTRHLSSILTTTHSGITWCVEFFFEVRLAVWKGVYDKEETLFREKFQDIIGKGTSSDGILSINQDNIQWTELYDYCYDYCREIAKRQDQFKTEETERLAGLLTQTPWNSVVVDFIKQGIESQGLDFLKKSENIKKFQEGISRVVSNSDVLNLDLTKVDWRELLNYCHKKLEWAISPKARTRGSL